MRDFLEFIATIGVLVVLVFGSVLGIGFPLASAGCHSVASKMGLESSWGPLQDCMVKVPASMFQDAHWVPLSSYRVAEVKQ